MSGCWDPHDPDARSLTDALAERTAREDALAAAITAAAPRRAETRDVFERIWDTLVLADHHEHADGVPITLPVIAARARSVAHAIGEQPAEGPITLDDEHADQGDTLTRRDVPALLAAITRTRTRHAPRAASPAGARTCVECRDHDRRPAPWPCPDYLDTLLPGEPRPAEPAT